MKNEKGKMTIASLFAFALIAYVGYCAFILISNKVKSDGTQREVMEKILKLRPDENMAARATKIIISTVEAGGYDLENEDIRAIEVFLDRQKRVVEVYYTYSYEMDFLLFKHVNFIEVEDSRSVDRWN